MHFLVLPSALTRRSLRSWHTALFGKLLSILPHLVQMSLPLESLLEIPQAQLHSLCCVSTALHIGLLELLGWAVGLGRRTTYSPFPLPPHIKAAYFCLMGMGMQMEKSEGYSGKRDGQRGKERDKAMREEGITERGANLVSDREGWRATEAVLGNLMGERFQGDF